MSPSRVPELTGRQREILRGVVEEYVATGEPVGSKTLVERSGLRVSPSTVRAELAELERLGLLTHPHTSAGRIPTEDGFRYYAGELLADVDLRPAALDLQLTRQNEVDAALRATTEMLSEMTRLLALVSAPPLESATVRHVEVLQLQANVTMVVVITSSGGVSKRIFTTAEPLDPGLVGWAAEYLNESVGGLQLGTRVLRRRFDDPGLSPRERAFLALLRPAFAELEHDEQQLFVGGAAGLLGQLREDELEACRRALQMLERRAAALEVIGRSLQSPPRASVRVGEELENPALRDVAIVGAGYGLSTRTLGSVSLLGPVRMDYEKAIRSVRSAAFELSRFVEGVFEDN
jgi:heat-inducible transcriptional repressor